LQSAKAYTVEAGNELARATIDVIQEGVVQKDKGQLLVATGSQVEMVVFAREPTLRRDRFSFEIRLPLPVCTYFVIRNLIIHNLCTPMLPHFS